MRDKMKYKRTSFSYQHQLFPAKRIFFRVLFMMGMILAMVLVGVYFWWEKKFTISPTASSLRNETIVKSGEKEDTETTINTQLNQNANREQKTENKNANTTTPIPKKLNLAIPFTSQAPDANWDLPYQEACEEASMLMVHAYFSKQKISPETADKNILDIITFEKKILGYYEDTTAVETARVVEEKWGYDANVEDISAEKIKEALAENKVVLVPAAGRLLHNPHFTRQGPLYHMLVIRGYTDHQTFLTNDPGTKYGEGYEYAESTILKAAHDWNGGDVENGEQRMITVSMSKENVSQK